jgi:drug/metabolite transporter (DMT)-like permease
MSSQPAAPLSAQSAGPMPAPARTHVQLLALVLIWAVNFSVIKIGLAILNPLGFNALRFLLASIVVFLVLRRAGPVPIPAREDRGRIILLGLLGNLVYQLLFIHGMDRTRAGNASLLLAGTPILTAVLSTRLGHEHVDVRLWIGILLTVLGIGLVVIAGNAGLRMDRSTLTGDLLMLCTSAVWSVYTVGARKPIARYGPVAVTAWTLWIGAVGLILVGVPDLVRTAWSAVPVRLWVSVLYSGGLGIGIAYILWYRGVGSIGNARTASYSNLVPAFALAAAWPLLGEEPTAGQLLGAVVIIGGITLANLRPARRRRPPVGPEPRMRPTREGS